MEAQQISVIVLAYNRFNDTTGRCLSSLSEDPDFPRWDLCVVDNGSSQNDRDALLRTQARYPHMRVAFLDRNLGFPGGMNVGLRATVGDPVFLVGSDVIIPSGTVGRLVGAFASHAKAGLIGPVTNVAGNEQRIFMHADNPIQTILQEGGAFAEAGIGGCMAVYRLDFFCVGLRRSVFDVIGGLDEAYGIGYYEDFDYCLMARNAGFELLVAENAFVYHQGSVSFGAARERQKALIRRNKALLLKKHGRDVLLPHVRDGNLSVLRQYAEQAERGLPPPAIRIANRLRLASADIPRSFLKRWRYLRKVAVLHKRLAPYLAQPPARV